MLHLGNAGQLGLQPLFLLGEGEACRCVQLLEAPAALTVELQQVGVVLPGGGESHAESTPFYLATKIFSASCAGMGLTTGRVCA